MKRSRYSANDSTRRLRRNSSDTRAQMALSSSTERMVFMSFLLSPYVTSSRALEISNYIKSSVSTTPASSAAAATKAGATHAGRFSMEAGSAPLDDAPEMSRGGGSLSTIAGGADTPSAASPK